MNKYLIVFLLLCVAPINTYAFPQTDFQCVNNCTAQGNQYGLCQARCTWDSSPQQEQQQPVYQAPQMKQTDFQCVNKCTSAGYQYGLCMDRCSY